jgi:hypothetical protein
VTLQGRKEQWRTHCHDSTMPAALASSRCWRLRRLHAQPAVRVAPSDSRSLEEQPTAIASERTTGTGRRLRERQRGRAGSSGSRASRRPMRRDRKLLTDSRSARERMWRKAGQRRQCRRRDAFGLQRDRRHHFLDRRPQDRGQPSGRSRQRQPITAHGIDRSRLGPRQPGGKQLTLRAA